MFRRQATPTSAGLPNWPVSTGVSLVGPGTRTNTSFYVGHNPPTLLSSTPGTGTTGTTSYAYSLDVLGRFYVECVSTTSAVLGWRNAGAWSRQTITVPTYTNWLYNAPATSPDGTRLYFRTDAGLSEWSLNAGTRTATNVVDAGFGAPATGFTLSGGIQWVSPDTVLLESKHSTNYMRGWRLVRKVSGTWVSLDTFVESMAFQFSTCPRDIGPVFARQEGGGNTSIRRIVDNLAGPVILPTTSIALGTRMGLDANFIYLWYTDTTNVSCTKVALDGSSSISRSVAHGLSSPAITDVHPLDGGLCMFNSNTTCKMFRMTSSITAYAAFTISPVTSLTGRCLGEPIV